MKLKTEAWPGTYGDQAKPRMGFFTDTSVCIGCKACEVACKEWNQIPMSIQGFTGHSYDNTVDLGADTWRHVAFVEQGKGTGFARPQGESAGADSPGIAVVQGGAVGADSPCIGTPHEGAAGADSPGITSSEVVSPAVARAHDRLPAGVNDGASLVEAAARGEAIDGGVQTYQEGEGIRWLMASDVCKHCTHAACLDVCPTGALFRTEFGTVVVQEDVCNGCGYCVPACPFGVLDQREEDGRVWKCTLCYDRLKDDKEPACAQACPTNSIQFGELTELRDRAEHRLAHLQQSGQADAQLYLADDDDGIGGAGAFFLLLDDPEVYGLPPDPVDTRRDLGSVWAAAGAAALMLGGAVAGAVWGGRGD